MRLESSLEIILINKTKFFLSIYFKFILIYYFLYLHDIKHFRMIISLDKQNCYGQQNGATIESHKIAEIKTTSNKA